MRRSLFRCRPPAMEFGPSKCEFTLKTLDKDPHTHFKRYAGARRLVGVVAGGPFFVFFVCGQQGLRPWLPARVCSPSFADDTVSARAPLGASGPPLRRAL